MDDICAEIEKLAEQDKRAAMANRAETKYKTLSKELADILEENDPEAVALAMMQSADEAIDSFVDSLLSDPNTTDFIDAVAYKVNTTNVPAVVPYQADADVLSVAREYVALMTLKKNKKTLEKIIKAVFDTEVDTTKSLRALPKLVTNRLKGPVKKLILGELESKLDSTREALRLAGATLADTDDVFSEIKELKKEYDEAIESPYVVPHYHDGQMELVETDPFLADLRNYKYTVGSQYGNMAEKFDSVMLAINRLSRAMQTTFNPSSSRNQGFRDPMNSITNGAAYYFTGYISKELQEHYIDEIVKWVKDENPENWKALEQRAKELDTTPEALAIEMLFERASVNSTTLVKWMREPSSKGDEATNVGYWGEQARKTKRAAGKVIDVLAKPAESAGDWRESQVRRWVIENMILKSMRNGKTVEEALRAAQFAGANANTNYGRMLVHMENFRRTVNYFGAGVNGFKSFWRMFELDPIGITVRLSLGIIAPIIAATIFSLINEKDRKVYRALKEYEKKNQFVLVINGKLYTIPIPQEMYGITSMVRSATESLFNGNRHAFWELAMNDLLGFGPVDFSDFMDIDANRFAQDPTFLERLGGLGLSFVNQFSPVATKSVIEATFGIDTYTGKPIDTSYKEFDDDGNLIVINPRTTGKFAEEIGKFTGWSAPIISHTIKNIIGQVGEDILDTIIGGQSPLEIVNGFAEDLLSVEGSNYDRIDQEWKANIASLWREKEKLLEDYNEYNKQIGFESDPEKQKKLRTDRQNLIDPFLKKVSQAVKTLKEQYPGSYDQFRFGSVVSLLTFDTGATTNDTAEQIAGSNNTYYENLERAYMWMQDLGIQSTDSPSILGYVTTDKKTGKPTVKYNMPTSILAARDAYMNKGDRNEAEIKLILKTAGINSYDKTNSDEYKAAKAAGGDTLKQYKSDWNTKVIKEVAPYIQDMGVENILANDTVRDLLVDYLFDVNLYKVKDYLTKIFKEAK